MAATDHTHHRMTVATLVAGDSDGSQPAGPVARVKRASSMATLSAPKKMRGFRPSSCVDRSEYATHHEATCSVTRCEAVARTFPSDDHDFLSLDLVCPSDVQCSGTLCASIIGVLLRDVTLLGWNHADSIGVLLPFSVRRNSREIVRDASRLSLTRCGEICLSVERHTLLLCFPRRRNKRDLRIGEIPTRAHHVTREMTPQKRTYERLADFLTVRATSELLRESVRCHNVTHSVTSFRLHDVTISRNAQNCYGTHHVIPANSDIRSYASRAHNTHHVCSVDNIVTIDNTPPTPRACPCFQNGQSPPGSAVLAPKFRPTYPRRVICSTNPERIDNGA